MDIVRIALFLCCLAATGVAQDVIAIRDVSVIDGTGAPLRTEQTVLIRANRIAGIGPAGAVSVPKGAVVVDGKGKFLLPGLWDMHIHFRGSMKGGEKLVKENEAMLPFYLAHGVTGVREMGGDMADTVLQWRDEIERGQRQGPRIATCGPKLDGPKPSWPGSIAITTPQEARAAVRTVKTMGANFVKVYHGLSHESLMAVAEEAKRQQLRLTGHPGGHFTMLEISDLGMDIEHAFPTMGFASTRDELALVRPATGHKVSPVSLEGARIVVEQYDANAVKKLIARFLKNGTALTPTLHAQWSTVLAPPSC